MVTVQVFLSSFVEGKLYDDAREFVMSATKPKTSHIAMVCSGSKSERGKFELPRYLSCDFLE